MALMAASCSDEAPVVHRPIGPDVSVVELDHLPLPEPPDWQVERTANLSIGEADGPPERVLVFPVAAFATSAGGIVVRNSMNGLFEIRYYDEAGQHLATASRFGDGPFEFRYPLGLHLLPGDSVLVLGEDGRFAVFGPRGERVRAGRDGMESLLPLVSGSLLIDPTHAAVTKIDPGQGLPEGVYRGGAHQLAFDLESHTVDTVAFLLGSPGFYEPMTRGGMPGVHIFPYPLRPVTSAAAGGGLLWVGQADIPAIRGYAATGGLQVVIRFAFDPPETTREHRRRFREEMLRGQEGERATQLERYSVGMEFPAVLPYFDQLKVDREGNVWVKRYEPPWAEGPQYWDVFDQHGLHIATAALPGEILPACARQAHAQCDRIQDIGSDYVLIGSGPGDIPRVSRYTLQKPN